MSNSFEELWAAATRRLLVKAALATAIKSVIVARELVEQLALNTVGAAQDRAVAAVRALDAAIRELREMS